jgi:hypothetical protein
MMYPMACSVYVRALNGEPVDRLQFRSAMHVIELVRGKPTERRELSGPDGSPIASASLVAMPTETIRMAAESLLRLLKPGEVLPPPLQSEALP